VRRNLRNIAALVAMTTYLVACATTYRAAYSTIGITKATVDTGMKIWANAVVKGQTTPEQEAKVHAAHDQYRATASSLKVVLLASDTNPTPVPLQSAALALINLIEQFTGKKVAQ
jgi:hypothetical protein